MIRGPEPIGETLAADSAALAAAASAAEEALQLEREALAVLRDGWHGDSGSAAADFIESHCREGEAVVAALRHAAAVLGSLGDTLSTAPPGDPAALARDQATADLGDRTPSNFPAPYSAASSPAMSWPSALPDLGGAIAALIAQAADALGTEPADPVDPTDLTDEPEIRHDPVAAVTKPPSVPPPVPPAAPDPVAPPPQVQPAAPVTAPLTPAPVDAVPLLAAEVPPSEPVDRAPCEIAADELPQVGQ